MAACAAALFACSSSKALSMAIFWSSGSLKFVNVAFNIVSHAAWAAVISAAVKFGVYDGVGPQLEVWTGWVDCGAYVAGGSGYAEVALARGGVGEPLVMVSVLNTQEKKQKN